MWVGESSWVRVMGSFDCSMVRRMLARNSWASKAPLCKGGWIFAQQKDWGIDNPSVTAYAVPPPLTQGRIFTLGIFGPGVSYVYTI